MQAFSLQTLTLTLTLTKRLILKNTVINKDIFFKSVTGWCVPAPGCVLQDRPRIHHKHEQDKGLTEAE